jgi:hypothetical protein
LMWGDVLTGLLVIEGLAERTRTGGQARRRELAVTQTP